MSQVNRQKDDVIVILPKTPHRLAASFLDCGFMQQF